MSCVISPAYSITEDCIHIQIRLSRSSLDTGSNQRGPTQVEPSLTRSVHCLVTAPSRVRSCQYCGRYCQASEELTKLWRRPTEWPISWAITP